MDAKDTAMLAYISAIPYAIHVSAAYGAFASASYGNTEEAWRNVVLLSAMIGSEVFVKLVKMIPWDTDSSIYAFTRRPAGATGCDILSRNGPEPASAAGTISGHMLSVALFATFSVISKWRRDMNREPAFLSWMTHNVSFVAVHVLLVVLTAYARTKKRCHSWPQIAAGSVLGIVIGLMAAQNVR